MPLITFTKGPLSIEISDHILGATKIKRKAKLDFLKYHPTAKEVTISVIVSPFVANEDGTYGASMEEDILSRSFSKEFTATMNHYCDAATGEVLCQVADEYAPDGSLNAALVGKNYAAEFEFYNNLAFTVPIIINNLISGRIRTADINNEFDTN